MTDSPTPRTDAQQAEWLADKIPAYGDYAKEAAGMLRKLVAQIAAKDAELAEAHQLLIEAEDRSIQHLGAAIQEKAKREQAEALAAANEKDAQRYRWLRQFAGKPESFPDDVADPASPEDMDSTIDVAIGGRDA